MDSFWRGSLSPLLLFHFWKNWWSTTLKSDFPSSCSDHRENRIKKIWQMKSQQHWTSDPSEEKCSFPYLSLVFIWRALASIFAPMSPIPFPLISTFVREVLLPSALIIMVTSVFNLESARDSDCKGWGKCKQHTVEDPFFYYTPRKRGRPPYKLMSLPKAWGEHFVSHCCLCSLKLSEHTRNIT